MTYRGDRSHRTHALTRCRWQNDRLESARGFRFSSSAASALTMMEVMEARLRRPSSSASAVGHGIGCELLGRSHVGRVEDGRNEET